MKELFNVAQPYFLLFLTSEATLYFSKILSIILWFALAQTSGQSLSCSASAWRSPSDALQRFDNHLAGFFSRP